MTLTLEISPKVQHELAREAEVLGVSLPALAATLLEQAMTRPRPAAATQHTPFQIRQWLDSLAEFSDDIPDRPGETFSRAMIYQDHD
jgi:hypothetical protein